MNLTRRESTWLSCAAKTCCRTSIVVVTGRDVWRIARALDAPPHTFLVYFASPEPRRDAFALDHSDRRFRLALAKHAPKRKGALPSCVFLLRTRQGQHRCGLGELRPRVCKTFPCTMSSGMLHVSDGGACSCRRWSLADVDLADEIPLVRERQADAEEYCDVVARWNEQVRSSAGPRDFGSYCQYLIGAYSG
jgi:Fe-S-cluster containining protein